MIDRIDELMASTNKEDKPDQCWAGLRTLRNMVADTKPSVYLEVGCARLATFSVFHQILRPPALAIGIDLKARDSWADYKNAHLFAGGSENPEVIKSVKEVLGSRQIDFLFIDGNHYEEYVQADWDNYSPMVRSGGIVAFHDWDPPAVARGDRMGQGAAITCNKLATEGYTIHNIKKTAIGTAYVYKK